MYRSPDFAFNFISPWIDFRPFCRFSNCRIIRIMPPSFRWDQLCDMAHDLMTDLIELLTHFLPASLRFEGTERLADIDLDFGASSALEAGEYIVEPDQPDG